MNDQAAAPDIDNVLLQLALQTRENAVQKVQIHHQIKGLRTNIDAKKSLIQTLETNIEKLTEEIKLKQNILTHHTETVKSIKATNRRLQQYEQSLKEKAQSQLSSYNQELEVLEEKYTSCKNTFRSYKEYYCRHPLAQKLLALQAEREEIERRIKVYDGEITKKQKELRHLSDISTTSEEITESLEQEQLKEPEKQLNPQVEADSASSVNISSFIIEQIITSQNSHKSEDSQGKADVQDTAHGIIAPEESANELFSTDQLIEQTWQGGKHTEHKETSPEKRVAEEEPGLGGTGEAEGQNINDTAMEEEQAAVRENTEAFSKLACSSQGTNSLSLCATGKSVPSTPLFSFNFSPGGSPLQCTSDSKFPVFPFSLNTDPSPTVFPGFRFDMCSSQNEDTSFGFSGFFTEKKTTDAKVSSCPEFEFNQQEQNEDFQFGFTSTSPKKDKKDSSFPFSFNF